jgi:hypothetical protein
MESGRAGLPLIDNLESAGEPFAFTASFCKVWLGVIGQSLPD